ncbi:MAG: dephospho-CoA kinase [Chlamydiales bacterium]
MLRLKKVAVTGSICSGKTTLGLFFEELGACFINSDAIVHKLLKPTTPVGRKVIDLLGTEIVDGNDLNRKEIASRVFRDLPLLEKVEKAIHPAVQEVIETKYQKVSQTSCPLFIVENPLLFESNQQELYDVIIVVIGNREVSQRRFLISTPYDIAEFERRDKRLIPIAQKCKQANFVVENFGSRSDLYFLAKKLFKDLKEE